MDPFEAELKTGFLDEAEQALADTEQCFLTLENDPNDLDTMNKILRLAHNLKGSSKAVGFDQMGNFAHQFENLILKVKNKEIPSTSQVVNLLLRGNDFLKTMVQGLKSDLNASFDVDPLIAEFKNPPVDGNSSAEPITINSEPHANLLETVAQPEVTIEGSSELASEVTSPVEPSFGTSQSVSNQAAPIEQDTIALEIEAAIAKNFATTENSASENKTSSEAKIQTSNPTASAQPGLGAPSSTGSSAGTTSTPSAPPATSTSTANPGAKVSATDESVRVSLSKVDSLVNSVGEMIILQSLLREYARAHRDPALIKLVQQAGKVGKEIQDLSMGLRMVPVKPTFQKMQRIVRDTAQVGGKEVQLLLQGEDTELDKTVLEKLNDPLVHLVRNCVDHGIEAPNDRSQKGKPSTGILKLKAAQESDRLIIEISDDGAGLNPEKLIKKATEKGLIPKGKVLTDKEARDLIFLPGFSTKEQVSEVSGRGVGMDVVKTNITELRGTVNIESEVGRGTTFRIALPLTLAIIEGTAIQASGLNFVLPISALTESLQLSQAQINETQIGEILILRQEQVPLYWLSDFFGLPRQHGQNLALIVSVQNTKYALVVDDLSPQFQVVVKPLGPEFKNYKGVSASTILGDGKPALIIDPIQLLQRSRTKVKASSSSNSSNSSGSAGSSSSSHTSNSSPKNKTGVAA